MDKRVQFRLQRLDAFKMDIDDFDGRDILGSNFLGDMRQRAVGEDTHDLMRDSKGTCNAGQVPGEILNSACIITVDDAWGSPENSNCIRKRRKRHSGIPARTGRNIFMRSTHRCAVGVILPSLVLICCAAALLSSSAPSVQEKAAALRKSESSGGEVADAFRFNTLGVAYMNQQRPADAQKYFERALQADPKFAVARLNLGISLLAQQKLEPARAALEAAAQQLPKDAYAWYNLGLVYKDLGDPDKGIAAFQYVTEIAPNEPDAYYFAGYLNAQVQKYDEAIATFQKGLALSPFHASSEFGLARAFQRKGDAAAAREHLARFQKITTEHLGTPFGAGYGDQGRFSLAELPLNSVVDVPAAIPVRFTAEANAFVSKNAGGSRVEIGPSTGACFFDYDGDGKT